MIFLNFLSKYRTHFGDVFWSFASVLGEEKLAIVIVCILYWCVNKKLGKILGYIFFITSFIVQGLKIGFRIERPWILDPNLIIVKNSMKNLTGYSFPSGHVQSSISIFGSLSFWNKKKIIKFIFFLIPLFVAFSRLYLGVHTLKDVTVSFVVTILISYEIIKNLKKNKLFNEIFIFFTVVFLLISLTIFSYILVLKKIIVIEKLEDISKITGASLGFLIGVYLEEKIIDFDLKVDVLKNKIFKIFFGFLGIGIIYKVFSYLILVFEKKEILVYGSKYFVLMLWIIFLWPLVFKKILK